MNHVLKYGSKVFQNIDEMYLHISKHKLEEWKC